MIEDIAHSATRQRCFIVIFMIADFVSQLYSLYLIRSDISFDVYKAANLWQLLLQRDGTVSLGTSFDVSLQEIVSDRRKDPENLSRFQHVIFELESTCLAVDPKNYISRGTTHLVNLDLFHHVVHQSSL